MRRRGIDWGILIPFGVISLLGLFTLAGIDQSLFYFRRQVVWHLLGVFTLCALLGLVDKKGLKESSPILYILTLLLLLAVLFVGKSGHGAQRWIAIGPFRMQPSEFAKISFALTLGYVLEWLTEKGRIPVGIPEALFILAVLSPMFLLVLVQPDLGTAFIFVLMALTAVMTAGIRKKVVAVAVVASVVVGYVAWHKVLKEYQKNRIRAFLNPARYSRTIGYHVIQSRIAIGSGGILGKGYMKTTQAKLGFMPEKHTDFIFSSFAEAWGFAGAGVLIALYAIFFSRIGELAKRSRSLFDFYSIVALGSVFFWHAFINLGMTMGMLPVVGVPLPLMSYGGSATLAAYINVACMLILSRGEV